VILSAVQDPSPTIDLNGAQLDRRWHDDPVAPTTGEDTDEHHRACEADRRSSPPRCEAAAVPGVRQRHQAGTSERRSDWRDRLVHREGAFTRGTRVPGRTLIPALGAINCATPD